MSKSATTLSPKQFAATFPHSSHSARALNAAAGKVATLLRVTKPEAAALIATQAVDKLPAAPVKPKRAGRKPGVMNATEAEFFAMLERRRQAGEFVEVAFEPFALPIEGDAKYTPDFVCIPSGLAPAFDITIAQLVALAHARQIDAPRGRWALDVALKEGLQTVHFFEAKGPFIYEGAKKSFRQARERYPWGKWEMHQKASKKDGGVWRELNL